MSKFAMSFATVAAYRSAKSSNGTAEIYTALIPASTTGSQTNVSRAVVSFIAELGRSVIDSVNTCVPYSEGGFAGDVLCYSPAHGYFWEKADASYDSDALGGSYHDAATWPSSFTRIGFCFYREGNHGLITEMGNGQGLGWNSDTATIIPGIFTSSSVPQGNRANTWIAGVKEAAEAVWGDRYYIYSWPFPRASWDEMVSRVKAGTIGSWTIGDSSYEISADANGGYQCTMTVAGTNTFTSNPADYGYNFDRWYRANIEARVPGPNGSVTSLAPNNGNNHDGIHNTRVLYATGKSNAANRAMGYSVNAPDYGAGMWWMPTTPEMIACAKVYPLLNKRGAGFSKSNAYWTSDQYNATYAWLVGLDGGIVGSSSKTNGNQVRLVSAFEIS